MHTSSAPDDRPRADAADVLIVGYGPVGQVLALLLARRGWQVTVVERWLGAYTMPRAVAFDGEAARILAAAGIGDVIDQIGEPSGEYVWKNAEGQVLLHIDGSDRRWCGWPESTSMYQPGLEAALMARGEALPNLRVFRGHEAVRLVDRGGDVEVAADTGGEQRVISARWVVGCDGANSFVREKIGTTVTDLGFSHDWLICDVVPHEQRDFSPNNLQICDPARPRTAVSAGPGHRRWEFMRVHGETVEGLNTAESAWRLLELFDVRPENAKLERHHVYTFQASYADQWRSGRLLLAGDAAHVMPPFAGQGMSSGFRDVANLAWRLDAILKGTADEGLLDSYAVERRAHVRHALGMSVNLGKIICQTDPVAAADRDTVMLAAAQRAVPSPKNAQRSPLQPLTRGFLQHGANGKPTRPAGKLTPQARVARGSETGRFDDVIGLGFVLLAAEDPRELLGADALRFLEGLGGRPVHILPAGAPPEEAGDGAVVDVDGVYLPFLTELDALGILVRPDFYVYGAARDREELGELVEELRSHLAVAVLPG